MELNVVEENNLALWNRHFKTDPSATKKVPKGGRSITAIDAYHQIREATKEWGPMGKWGLKNIELTVVGEIMWMNAEFFYPGGSFGTINSINMYMGRGEKRRVDDEAGKKLATDTITKCLSLQGYNADVFFGLFDDARYVKERTEEVAHKQKDVFDELKKVCLGLIKQKEIDKVITVEQYDKFKERLDQITDEAGLHRAKIVIEGMTKEVHDEESN